jgi:hypothetical protein
MNTFVPFRPVAIASLLMMALSACGGDRTPANDSDVPAPPDVPADSSTLLSQQKMYLSFEITLTGERKFGERAPADGLSDAAWRLNRSVKGEIPLDMPFPGLVPPSLASDNQMEMLEEGRCMGWLAAPPDDPAVMEQIMANKLEISRNPMYVPVEFRIDDEFHSRGREFPSEPIGTTSDRTIKGAGKAYTGKDGLVACDLKMKICDSSGILVGYADGTDLLTIVEMSSYPGDQGKSSTMGSEMMLPKISEALAKRLAGIKFNSSGPITTFFSEPYRDTYLLNVPGGEDPPPVLTVTVTVSPRSALGTGRLGSE